MKKKLMVCISTILTVGMFLPGISAKSDGSAENSNSVKSGVFTQSMVVPGSFQRPGFQEPDGKRLMTEVRTGPAVMLRARQLRAKNKGFARAYANFIKRGRRPLFEEAGITILGVDTSKLAIKRTAFAGVQDIVDGDSEMSFFPVDTGNSAVWEGIVYVRSPEGEATYSASLDTTHDDLSLTEVYYAVQYPSDGGGGSCVDGSCDQEYMAAMPKNGRGTVRNVAYGGASAPSPMAFGFFRNWLSCSAAGCITAASGCLLSGPLYLKCLGLWCGGSILGCGVGALILAM